ncbi:uncharacterized protein LOC127780208 [Oryza glaberrima]|uniref:uncharacterized protein LOC127780208 n=1 Tax=Oryza glaberrima TaxID=4538 RepID=UPI00224C1228|nr:uncharacterized protein LOC127780208 [Oryza glaberrima]
MDTYVRKVRCMERHFDVLELRHVPRRDNAVADELLRIASARAPLPPGTFEERLAQPSVRVDPPRDPDAMASALTPDDPRASGPEGVDPDPPRQVVWMTDIRAYLDNNTLPEDRAEAEKLARISKRYVLIEGTLYRRAANGILLKCISREQGVELIADAHQDILGPFKAARGEYQHLYVAIDKFTRWPEAYLVVKIDKHSTLKFIRGITCWFGVPNRIITDNGTQFTSELFGDYCDDMGIKLCFTSSAHPKSNGQVKRANAEIVKGLNTKTYNVLKKHGDSWLEELPAMLWANRTTPMALGDLKTAEREPKRGPRPGLRRALGARKGLHTAIPDPWSS